jgi:hypothetical protein
VPGLSIIIPAGEDVTRFEDTLAAVLRNRPRACEVIVPHAGTYADPYELASEVWFIELAPGATREACLAHAIEKAAGDVIHVLSPGCEFDDDWWQPAVAQFAEPSIGCVAPFMSTERDSDCSGVVGVKFGFAGRAEVSASARRDERALAKLKILGPTYRAGFYRRTALKQIGGWPTTLPHALADVDVALSLKQLGYRAAVEPQTRISCPCDAPSASAYELARQREQLFWRHLATVGGTMAVLAHPLAAVRDCFTAGGPLSMLAAMAGKCASLSDIGACRAHDARMQGLKRLTVTDAPPKSQNGRNGGEDRPRRAA